MAGKTDVFKMILEADDKASAVLGKVENASMKLGQSARPVASALGLIAGQLGAIGPVGNVAADVILGIARGVGSFTIASAGAVAGLGFLASAIRTAKQEKEDFAKAVESGDLGFFAKEVDRLNQKIGDREPFNLAKGNWQDLGKATLAVLFNLDEKLAAYKGQLETLSARRIDEITRAFQQQAAILGAASFERHLFEQRKAMADLSAQFIAGKITWQEFQASRAGLQTVGRAQVQALEEEISALGKSKEALEIMTRARLNARLAAVQQAGDTAQAAAIERDIEASRRRLRLMDEELRKSQDLAIAMHKAFEAIDPKNVLGDIVKKINEAFKSGLPPTPEQVQLITAALAEIQTKTFRTFGIDVPAHVQSAIDKVDSLIQKMLTAAGIKVEDKVGGVFSGIGGGGGGGMGGGSFSSLVESVRRMGHETGEIENRTEGWRKEIGLVDGFFTNLTGPAGEIRSEVKSIKDDSRGIFGDAITNARLLKSEVSGIKALIEGINQQGGIRVGGGQSLETQLRRQKLTSNDPE